MDDDVKLLDDVIKIAEGIKNDIINDNIVDAAYSSETLGCFANLAVVGTKRLFTNKFMDGENPYSPKVLDEIMYRRQAQECINPKDDLNYCWVSFIDPTDRELDTDDFHVLGIWNSGYTSSGSYEQSFDRSIDVLPMDYIRREGNAICMLMFVKDYKQVLKVLKDKYGINGTGYIRFINFSYPDYTSVLERHGPGSRFRASEKVIDAIEDSKRFYRE